MKKNRGFSMMGILFIVMVALTGLAGYALFSSQSTENNNLSLLGDDLKGAMKTMEGQLKDIRENQDSIDGKTATLFKGLDSRISKLEQIKPVDHIKLTLTEPVRVSLVYRKSEPKEARVPANVPGPLLKRAKEMSQ